MKSSNASSVRPRSAIQLTGGPATPKLASGERPSEITEKETPVIPSALPRDELNFVTREHLQGNTLGQIKISISPPSIDKVKEYVATQLLIDEDQTEVAENPFENQSKLSYKVPEVEHSEKGSRPQTGQIPPDRVNNNSFF